ncbi:T9SS type A sorting domain-containing protein [Flavicella sediminum]|uniref:T9SS type A sorting domain-containing protein n=1 Tax=Flavicella sediminum TaxID=2585141 RepID=UPI001AA08151|nr:T9SS type A sorting domain-containing protein [Flavicella sediminum]
MNVKHTVGGIDSFDRSKFITIHANQTEGEWDGDNFTSDLRNDFLNGLDVYLGRDTGGITWNLNNMEEDVTRPGFADPAKIASKGTASRNSFASKTNLHAYEQRKNHVVGAQLHPFWTGESQVATKKGWKLASPTAVGEYMGRYFNAFHGGNGQKDPAWVEIMNEPAYEALGGKKNYTNSLQEIADFHVEVADAFRAQNSNLKLGGYTVAFPDFETGNFQRWINRDKLFIDVAGEKMDFWSWHLYDFPAIGGKVDLRSGSNVEATFDMNDQYSMMKLGHKKPYVISEYGAQTHDYSKQGWSPYKDWLFLKAQNSLMMSFMERPDDIAIAIPFTIVKAEWGFNHTLNIPYSSRLMRKSNEPESYTGEWVYTNRVKFYELWKNVKGTRIDTQTSDLDIQVDAYVDGNKGYIILNNLEFVNKSIELSLFDKYPVSATNIIKRHLTLSGNEPIIDEEILNEKNPTVELGAESTMILEYSFDKTITIDEVSTESKYFATTYLQAIEANTSIDFQVNSVTKNIYGEAVLRLGLGRAHGKNLQPKVLFNDVEIDVPEDYRGYNQADKASFFGVLEIPVPYGLLKNNNEISVTFSETGGHISSVALQVFNFSSNIREFSPDDLAANNYKIKTKSTSCVATDNGAIDVDAIATFNYKARLVGEDYAKDFNFTKSFKAENLKAGSYDLQITIPEHPSYKAHFSLEVDEVAPLNIASKVDDANKELSLSLQGSDVYYIKVNNKVVQTNENQLVVPLNSGNNLIEVTTDQSCQGVYKTVLNYKYKLDIYPNPAKEKVSFSVPENLVFSSVFVFDTAGNKVYDSKVTNVKHEIQIANLSEGVYLLKLSKDSEASVYSKFMVN